MNPEEILKILMKTNNEMKTTVDVEILKHILSLVILNPLDDDRSKCQDQIEYIISRRVRDGKHESNKD